MFSYRHYGRLPGIDIAFLFGGTKYHTARDEDAQIRPGTLQVRGRRGDTNSGPNTCGYAWGYGTSSSQALLPGSMR